jgi:hypothetical protein
MAIKSDPSKLETLQNLLGPWRDPLNNTEYRLGFVLKITDGITVCNGNISKYGCDVLVSKL